MKRWFSSPSSVAERVLVNALLNDVLPSGGEKKRAQNANSFVAASQRCLWMLRKSISYGYLSPSATAMWTMMGFSSRTSRTWALSWSSKVACAALPGPSRGDATTAAFVSGGSESLESWAAYDLKRVDRTLLMLSTYTSLTSRYTSGAASSRNLISPTYCDERSEPQGRRR